VIATHYIYWTLFAIMMIGLYIVISHGNLLKKLIGLSVFQVGVFLFYISLGKVEGGSAPIISPDVQTYSHPLPQVLILTAIVVGVATLAVGLGLAVRIFETYGTVEEDEVIAQSALDPVDDLPHDPEDDLPDAETVEDEPDSEPSGSGG
jgi:multicomponent Na+:H+ antiporter subunit C